MTDERPLRGPDFLPYDRPAEPAAAAVLPAPPPGPPSTKGRWERALDGVPLLGVVSIAAGAAALVLLALISWIADRPGPGAVVVSLAAAVSLVTGFLAVKGEIGHDSRTLVTFGQTVGVVSAIASVLVWVAAPDDGGQTVSPPLPQPTASAQPVQPTPDPVTPTPVPGAGAVNGFGTPSTPGQPLSDDPTDLGTLLGHVVDSDGKPVPGADVTITRASPGDTSSTPDCPTRITTQTDAQGIYRQQLCQLGDNLGYTVTITVPGARTRTMLFVNSGQTTVYDVILSVKTG